jgi:hypothetical protein
MAQGTASAKDPRVGGLIAKVNALQTKVAGLQQQVTDLKTQSDAQRAKSECLKAQGVVLRGTAANEGYLYKKAADPSNLYLYSAFDAPDQGEAPQLYFATVASTCVTASYSGRGSAFKGRAPSVVHLPAISR